MDLVAKNMAGMYMSFIFMLASTVDNAAGIWEYASPYMCSEHMQLQLIVAQVFMECKERLCKCFTNAVNKCSKHVNLHPLAVKTTLMMSPTHPFV